MKCGRASTVSVSVIVWNCCLEKVLFVEVFIFHGANRILFSASRKWLKIECWGVILRLETWQIMITYEPLENDNRIRKTIQFETVLRLTIIFESMEFVSIISNIYNSLIPGSNFNFFKWCADALRWSGLRLSEYLDIRGQFWSQLRTRKVKK